MYSRTKCPPTTEAVCKVSSFSGTSSVKSAGFHAPPRTLRVSMATMRPLGAPRFERNQNTGPRLPMKEKSAFHSVMRGTSLPFFAFRSWYMTRFLSSVP